MSQAISKFVADVALHFPNRFDSEAAEDEWLDSMARNLRGYSADVLKRAAQKIIDTRTDRRFPLPSECKKVCNEFAQQDAAEKPGMIADQKLPPAFSDWRVKLADDLIMCPMGREAAKDGWILALHDFARENGRLPAGGEISKVKAVRKGFDAAYYGVINGNGGFCSAALKKLGDHMIARRKALADRVLHGVVQ